MAETLNVEEVVDVLFEGSDNVSGEESMENEGVSDGENERGDVGRGVLMDPNTDAIVFLKTKAIYPRQLLIRESRIWLEAIYRCLSGRHRIRQPFTSIIHRDIPVEIFNVLVPVVDKLGFTRPCCVVEKNSKAVVIAFSDITTATRFLSTLSAVATEELQRYFAKALRGRKSGSRVEVLVSEEKQFSLTYNIKRGQMDIFFYFGEWNAYGFPQHN